jgi:hypothetical protein
VNITLLINVTSAVSLASASVIASRYPLSSVGLAFLSGLLTSFASRFDVSAHKSP